MLKEEFLDVWQLLQGAEYMNIWICITVKRRDLLHDSRTSLMSLTTNQMGELGKDIRNWSVQAKKVNKIVSSLEILPQSNIPTSWESSYHLSPIDHIIFPTLNLTTSSTPNKEFPEITKLQKRWKILKNKIHKANLTFPSPCVHSSIKQTKQSKNKLQASKRILLDCGYLKQQLSCAKKVSCGVQKDSGYFFLWHPTLVWELCSKISCGWHSSHIQKHIASAKWLWDGDHVALHPIIGWFTSD